MNAGWFITQIILEFIKLLVKDISKAGTYKEIARAFVAYMKKIDNIETFDYILEKVSKKWKRKMAKKFTKIVKGEMPEREIKYWADRIAGIQ